MRSVKQVFNFLLVMVVIACTVAIYFSSQKKSFSPVDLNSYLLDEITGTANSTDTTVIKPGSEYEIIEALKSSSGPVTISGVHYSLGGQLKYQGGLYFDMSSFDQILDFDTERKLITVQSGISWRAIQKVIDPHNLSVKILPDNNDYSVGGSLSVNAHGRFINQGAIINSVKSIRIILADGNVYEASPEKNSALFYGAIGGYGGIGIITQATLELVDNIAIERSVKLLSFNDFSHYFNGHVLHDEDIVLHQIVLYPTDFEVLLDIVWKKTDKPLLEEKRLRTSAKNPWWESVYVEMLSRSTLLQRFQKNLIDPYKYKGATVESLNFETSQNFNHSGFINNKKSTMALQEYIIPANRFEIFVFNLRDIFSRHDANIYKILINYVPQDKKNAYTGEGGDFYSFKILYLMDKKAKSGYQVAGWTEELVRASIESHGTHILPFLISDSSGQIYKTFPDSKNLFDLKKRTDPANRFRNVFWDQHQYEIYRKIELPLNTPINSSLVFNK